MGAASTIVAASLVTDAVSGFAALQERGSLLGYLTKEALLKATDITEQDVELPSLGKDVKVKVRSLSAAYSNQAQSEALVTKQVGRDQISTVDVGKLEVIQAFHGLVEPKLETMEEAEQFAENCGPAFKEVIRVLDEISGVDKEAIEKAETRFRASRKSANGSAVGDSDAPGEGSDRSDIPPRTGAGTGEKR